MIVDRIYEYLGGTLATADAAVMDAALRSFKTSMLRNFTDKERGEHRKGLFASSPWYCARRVLYENSETPREPNQPRSLITFFWGDACEAFGIFLTRLSTVLILSPGLDGVQEAHEIRVGGAVVEGHIDMTVRDTAGNEIPVDWKSMSKIGFSEFEQAIRNPAAKWWTEQRWAYLTQLRLYMMAKGSPYGVFVGVSKETGHMAEMHVPPDPAWNVEVIERADRLKALLDSHAAPDSIPRPPWATTTIKSGANERADGTTGPVEEIDNWRCDYCPFWRSCFPGYDLVPLKSGPVRRKAVEPQAIQAAKAGTA